MSEGSSLKQVELERRVETLEKCLMQLAVLHNDACDQVKSLASHIELIAKNAVHPSSVPSHLALLHPHHVAELQQPESLVYHHQAGADMQPQCSSQYGPQITALLVGGQHKEAWSTLVRSLFEANVVPSTIQEDPAVIASNADPGSFDLIFMSAGLDQGQSYGLQTTLRRVYPNSMIVGVALDPGELLEKSLSLMGFEEVVLASARPEDVKRLLFAYRQHQQGVQFGNTPFADEPLGTPDHLVFLETQS